MDTKYSTCAYSSEQLFSLSSLVSDLCSVPSTHDTGNPNMSPKHEDGFFEQSCNTSMTDLGDIKKEISRCGLMDQQCNNNFIGSTTGFRNQSLVSNLGAIGQLLVDENRQQRNECSDNLIDTIKQEHEDKCTINCQMQTSYSSLELNSTQKTQVYNSNFRGSVCVQCNKCFDSPDDLKNHNQIVHKEARTFECQECGLSFVKKSSLNMHKRWHGMEEFDKGGPFKCQDCNKTFLTTTSLRFHYKWHKWVKSGGKSAMHNLGTASMESLYKCQDCDKMFIDKRSLNIHRNTHKFEESNKQKGESMASKSQSTEELKYEFRSYKEAQTPKYHYVTSENNFKCHLCDERFSNNCALQRHYRVHRKGPKFYKCNDTNPKQAHRTSHSKVDGFHCIDCNKWFSRRTYLDSHNDKVHKKEQATCIQNLQKSKDSQHLSPNRETPSTSHLNSTEGLKSLLPYCTACSMWFSTKEELEYHQQINHKRETRNKSVNRQHGSQMYSKEQEQYYLQSVSKKQQRQSDCIGQEQRGDNTRKQHGDIHRQSDFRHVEQHGYNKKQQQHGHNTQQQFNSSENQRQGDINKQQQQSDCIKQLIYSIKEQQRQGGDNTKQQFYSREQRQQCGINEYQQQSDSKQEKIYCKENSKEQNDCQDSEHVLHSHVPSGLQKQREIHLQSAIPVRLTTTASSQVTRPSQVKNVRVVYKCGICGMYFTTNHDLACHYRRHVGKSFLCTKCNRVFSDVSILDSHHQECSNNKPFECKICHQRYDSEDDLKDHSQKHTKIQPQYVYNCENCLESFANIDSLEQHCEIEHTDLECDFKCEICTREFKTRLGLEDHGNYCGPHAKNTGVKCPTCKMVFLKDCNLYRHCRGKHKEKPFKCLHCSAEFEFNANLKRHYLYTHGGDFPFKCTVCSRSFLLEYHLIIHSKKHAKKPFHCTVCGAGFTTMKTLKHHLYRHTGEKSFKCIDSSAHCIKKYSFKCTICSASFPQKD